MSAQFPAQGILADHQIRDAIVNGELVVGCAPETTAEWDTNKGQIQPSSIDLYAHEFYTHDGDKHQKHDEVELKAGGAVLIITRESLSLPDDVAGFVSAPTHLSFVGFFSPSVGHIDPGFKGQLKLVGINMAKNPLPLSRSTKVATVVLYKMSAPATHPYHKRVAPLLRGEPRDIIAKFATDFGNFRETARSEARSIAMKFVIIPIFLGVFLIAALQILSNGVSGYIWNMNEMKADIARLEGQVTALQKADEPARPPSDAVEPSSAPQKQQR